jgi:hypothetical protein
MTDNDINKTVYQKMWDNASATSQSESRSYTFDRLMEDIAKIGGLKFEGGSYSHRTPTKMNPNDVQVATTKAVNSAGQETICPVFQIST